MAWNNVPEEFLDETTNEEFEEELESQTGADEELSDNSEEVEGATEVTEEQQGAPNQGEKQTADVPYAVLKVYGKYIPIESKEALIALAQQGVDYDNKMYKLKEWRSLINLYETNSVLKDLSTRALKGEDITNFVKSSNEPETTESSKFKDYIKKEVNKELTPYQTKIDELERKLFFEEMKKNDPDNFDTIMEVCKEVYNLPSTHPNAMPSTLKKQINEDKEVFKVYYNFIKDKVVAFKNNQPQPEVPEELGNTDMEQAPKSGVQLKRSVKKAPILESAKGSEPMHTSSLSDAEKIWKMPSSKFQEMMKKAESGYKR